MQCNCPLGDIKQQNCCLGDKRQSLPLRKHDYLLEEKKEAQSNYPLEDTMQNNCPLGNSSKQWT